VVTGGIGTFTPRPLTALAPFESRGLAYFVPRPDEYRERDVVIVGGGDSAFAWALTLSPLARSVTIVHRRETFRAHEALVQQVADLGVPVITSAELVAASGGGWIEAVDVQRKRTKETTRRKTQAVVAALGFTADISALESWGLDIAERRLVVDTAMATNLNRVCAAGDITEYPGKVRLIAIGFGEAATAVNNAVAALDPKAPLFPGHSSDAGRGLLLVEQNGRLALGIAQHAFLLERGAVILTGTGAELLGNAEVIERYLGEVQRRARTPGNKPGPLPSALL
jgi:thioredoxin reductase